MKGKSSRILEKIIGALSSKRNELKVRIMIFILLHKKMDRSTLITHSNFSHNLQALVAHPYPKKIHDNNGIDDEEEEEDRVLMMHYNKVDGGGAHTEDEEDKCHKEDLTRVLFEESEVAMEEDEEEEEEVMVDREREDVSIVKEVVEVREENVDHAADLFIKRFKREIHLQI